MLPSHNGMGSIKAAEEGCVWIFVILFTYLLGFLGFKLLRQKLEQSKKPSKIVGIFWRAPAEFFWRGWLTA